MRGSSLSNPQVIQALRPFIVTVWNGENRRQMPDDVRGVYESADLNGIQGNIVLFVLDWKGKVIRAFQPFPGLNPSSLGFDRERMGRYLLDEIERATKSLKLPTRVPKKETLSLPTVVGREKPAGLRVLASFDCARMSSYRAPVVEAVAIQNAERQALKWPQRATTVPAKKLERWLEQIYPPAIMDRSGRIKEVSGNLTLTPAGKRGNNRFAVLRGRVHLVMDDGVGTAFDGGLELVVTYSQRGNRMESLKGVFKGVYPKPDRRHNRTLDIGIMAAIETISD